jgi:F-type H+-transporting ATPase subunit delta
MIREPVAKRYAQALFEAARKRSLLETIAGDLEGISSLLRAELGFRRFLSSPRCTRKEMDKLFRKVFADHVHSLTHELFNLLMEKKRLPILDQIIEAYLDMLDVHRGIVTAEVTTAVPVSDEFVGDLISKLEAGSGKQVKLEQKINPDIIAGAMVRFGDQIIDRSLKRMLTDLRAHLNEVPVSDR